MCHAGGVIEDDSPSVCGNGVLEAKEECDGDIVPYTCNEFFPQSFGGTVTCTNQCKIDISTCKTCNLDGVKDYTEECDGHDLRGATCKSVNSSTPFGRIGCNNKCEFVTRFCSADEYTDRDYLNSFEKMCLYALYAEKRCNLIDTTGISLSEYCHEFATNQLAQLDSASKELLQGCGKEFYAFMECKTDYIDKMNGSSCIDNAGDIDAIANAACSKQVNQFNECENEYAKMKIMMDL